MVNLLQILGMSFRLWYSQIRWYTLAGLVLLLSIIISAGLASGTLIIDGAIALFFGPAGTWISQPLLLLTMFIITSIGLLVSSYLVCASVGAFLHACAQIGAGHREINLLGYLDYAAAQGVRFWLIGLVVLGLCAILAVPVAMLGVLFSSFSPLVMPLSLVAACSLALLITLPFWLTYPAQVIKHAGVTSSLLGSLKATAHSPLASIILLLLLLFFFFVPMVSLILYPIYFFFIYAPLAGTLMLIYYESVMGIIKE